MEFKPQSIIYKLSWSPNLTEKRGKEAGYIRGGESDALLSSTKGKKYYSVKAKVIIARVRFPYQ
jgi:hypothetical protein